MLKQVLTALSLCLLTVSCATPSKIRKEGLVGSWRCGPTLMQGPGFTVSVTDETTKSNNGTFTGLTTTVISKPGAAPLELRDRSSGTWELVGDVVKSHVLRVEFLSASDPNITKEEGQLAQEEQLSKKSIYESRILELKKNSSRSVPVNSMYKEAVVESNCQRI